MYIRSHLSPSCTHTQTHTHIHVHVYMCMLTCVPSDYDDDYADAGGDFPAAVDQGFEGAFDAFPEQQHNQTSASFQGVEPMGQFMREGTVSPLGVGGSVCVGTREGQCLLQGGALHRTVCEGRGRVALWGYSRYVRGGAVPVYVGTGEEQCPLLGGAPHRTVCEGQHPLGGVGSVYMYMVGEWVGI